MNSMTPEISDRTRLPIARRQADWINALHFEDIPDKSIALAKDCVFDFLGLAIKGSTVARTEPARRLVKHVGASGLGATVIGGGKTAVFYAAYANGTFGHSLEYDDCQINCGHPGACVIPAAFAMAEAQGATGRDLLTAIVAGYQSMVWSIAPIHRRTLELGWHGTKVAGPFGAAAAAGKLLDLSSEQIAHALSIAASESSGPLEYSQSGGEVKRVHAGSASRSGVQAALLAEAGLTGPREIFEGLRGIYRLFSNNSPYDVEQYWTGKFHIDDVMFKLYPSPGSTHAAFDAFTRLQREHGFTHDMVEAVFVDTADWSVAHGASIYEPTDVVSAQFSLAFGLALLAVIGRNRLEDYSAPENWRDPVLLDFAHRVEPVSKPVPPGASELFTHVHVQLKDGRRVDSYQPAPRGYPSNPATEDDLSRKFLSITDGVLASRDQDELRALIGNLDNLTSLDPIIGILGRVKVPE